VPGADRYWYKDALIYQVHVRSFADGDGDGIGDFKGLIGKLDYLRDLGVTAIWLMPFYPSPLRDDGYDIADYRDIHPSYGTLGDFRAFMTAAHRRGLKVVTELVLNHTSDQHAWFQRARRARAGSNLRDFYVWSDTPERYADTRVIFKDFETSNWGWDPVARAYFFHRFYAHQPDLNFDNATVRREMIRIVDYWLEMGVDGLRLDAVPYLFEREGTTNENLAETHDFLKQLRAHIDQHYGNRMLLAEANQWPSDAVAYFGDDDECNMAFHFPVMPRLFMALRMEDRYPVVEVLEQTPSIPPNAQWAIFLRNHDELTLEMVTDEDRDYMYRVYAKDEQARINLGIRRRLAPLLGNDRRRMELLNGLLLSLPGSPILYYGDEIGMGDNIYLGDRNGVRTPMQWSSDRNAGFSSANPQRLFLPVIIDPQYHYETVNVEAQRSNPHSLYWWMKRVIALRKRHRAFSRGSIEFVRADNHRVLAFVRRYEDEAVLVVANLSRFPQAAELPLAEFRGVVPIEMFGQTAFPPVGENPYFLTLGPHSFFWFLLQPVPTGTEAGGEGGEGLPVIEVRNVASPSNGLFEGLPALLPRFLRSSRWFGGRSRRIKSVELDDEIPLPGGRSLLAVLVDYSEGEPDRYVVPVALATSEEHASRLLAESPHAAIAWVRDSRQTVLLYDAAVEPGFAAALLDAMQRRRRYRGKGGELVASRTRLLGPLLPQGAEFPPLPPAADQSNTSIRFDEALILKLFRRLEAATNPELEILAYLLEGGRFPQVPALAGYLEYRRPGEPAATVGVLQGFVRHECDAWTWTVDALGRFMEAVHVREGMPPSVVSWREFEPESELPPVAEELMGAFLRQAALLGQRTAEMHLALAGEEQARAFAPEPIRGFDRNSIAQGMLSQANRVLQVLKRSMDGLQPAERVLADHVLALEPDILRAFEAVPGIRSPGQRIRTHGDYHLGQVLFTGEDFVIIDFEGEPARPISERRIKRSPLRDVAGMIRSFDYAANTAIRGTAAPAPPPEGADARVAGWAAYWSHWTAMAFLRSYIETIAPAKLLPTTTEDLRTLLNAYLLDKALYEVRYELDHRPAWVDVPLRGVIALVMAPPAADDGNEVPR
jgi:maltose alpha-D-glucosyltransferase/alpha-amylase